MSDSTQNPEPIQEIKNEQDVVKPTETPTENEPTYSKQEMAKIMEEVKKYRSQAKDLQTKIKQREVEELTKNQEFQKLADIRAQEAEAAREELSKFKGAFVHDKKMAAVREASLSLGLNRAAIQELSHIDFPEVKIETNSEGEVIVMNADKAAQRIKATRPYLFQAAVPTINTQSPGVTSGKETISWDDLRKIEMDYKKNPNKQNEEIYRNAIHRFSGTK